MRIKRVRLEHHGDPAFGSVYIVHPRAPDGQIAAGNIFQPGNHPQQGGFSAARRADKDHKLLWLNHQIDALDHLMQAVCLAQLLQL